MLRLNDKVASILKSITGLGFKQLYMGQAPADVEELNLVFRTLPKGHLISCGGERHAKLYIQVAFRNRERAAAYDLLDLLDDAFANGFELPDCFDCHDCFRIQNNTTDWQEVTDWSGSNCSTPWYFMVKSFIIYYE